MRLSCLDCVRLVSKFSIMKYFEGKKRQVTEKFLQVIEANKKPHYFTIKNKQYVAYPGVFSPKFFRDPDFFVKQLPIRRGEQFLEIGSGTGVISIAAAQKGAAHVTAVDINPIAVKNTKENVRRFGLTKKVTVTQSNVYSTLGQKKFDTIFWNTPWGHVRKKKLTNLEQALWDPYYAATKRFITQARKHLRPNGRLLIGFSSTIGDQKLLNDLLKKYEFSNTVIARHVSRSVDFPARFEIIEAVPKSGSNV